MNSGNAGDQLDKVRLATAAFTMPEGWDQVADQDVALPSD
jgi:hypothetical protein